MKLSKNTSLLFTGDSITDCGRDRPLGQRHGLGNGYVSLVNALLQAVYPDHPVRVLNTGIGGNRVIDLKARWQEDVLAHSPHWLSIMIGINDVWRQFDNPLDPVQVTPDIYRETLEALIVQTRPQLEGLVLMSPFYIEQNAHDPMRSMMDDYSAIVSELAEKYDAVFVDVQGAYCAYLEHQPTQNLCGDRVHPNLAGHTLIAKAFLDAIGFSWDRPERA